MSSQRSVQLSNADKIIFGLFAMFYDELTGADGDNPSPSGGNPEAFFTAARSFALDRSSNKQRQLVKSYEAAGRIRVLEEIAAKLKDMGLDLQLNLETLSTPPRQNWLCNEKANGWQSPEWYLMMGLFYALTTN